MAIEVEENVAELGKLALKLSLGPQRDQFLNLVAESNPDLPIPEVKTRKALEAATKPLLEKIDALEGKLTKKESLEALAERRKVVSHLDKPALAKLEQFMVDKGIADYEIANREMQRLDQVATPRVSTGKFGRAEMPTADKDNLLYKDPARFRSNTLHSLIDDLQAGKRI